MEIKNEQEQQFSGKQATVGYQPEIWKNWK